ncbi:MAG: hypothetical protein JO305_00670 [Alphaproteobacteria bacterium]|nr:hypothetical protein [Alphaproteobacteria bacterium]MBV9828319.1 hypothetical protein [Alphaproteobacteria bacterium]
MDPKVRQEIREFQTDDGADDDAGIFTQIARLSTPMLVALDVVACIALVAMAFIAPSDPAAKGLGVPLAGLIGGLFVLTTIPALVLVVLRRSPRLAMLLTIAFPLLFIAAYVTLGIAFPG